MLRARRTVVYSDGFAPIAVSKTAQKIRPKASVSRRSKLPAVT